MEMLTTRACGSFGMRIQAQSPDDDKEKAMEVKTKSPASVMQDRWDKDEKDEKEIDYRDEETRKPRVGRSPLLVAKAGAAKDIPPHLRTDRVVPIAGRGKRDWLYICASRRTARSSASR